MTTVVENEEQARVWLLVFVRLVCYLVLMVVVVVELNEILNRYEESVRLISQFDIRLKK